jgi:hypothetical protein
MQLAVVVLSRKAFPSPRTVLFRFCVPLTKPEKDCTKECSPATTCHGPFDKPERPAQPRLLARTGAAHAGRPGPGACLIQRALAGHLKKRNPGPQACQCRGLNPPLEGGNAPIRASRQRKFWPPVPTSPGGRQPTPKDRAALAPRGDRSWRCSTAQLRVRPGGSGCATQGDARGPSSTRRTVLTATDPRDQPNAEPPLTPSPERAPRIAHAALGCAILVHGECSRSTGRHARERPLERAVVVASSDGSTQV